MNRLSLFWLALIPIQTILALHYYALDHTSILFIVIKYSIHVLITCLAVITVFVMECFKKDLRIPDRFAKTLWYKGYFGVSLMAIVYLVFKYCL